jgi:hypothetical protein
MRCLYPIALFLVISLFGLEAKAGLEGDDFDDLTLSFKAKEAAIPADATEACLSGTFDGTAFVACDAVESKGGNR